MLPIQLVENPAKVGHSPTHMHKSTIEWFANIATVESIPKVTLIWGLKVLYLCQCQHVINLDTTILI
jgi:hypothetical protein